MSGSVLILTLIDSAVGFAAWVAVLAVTLVYWSDTRPRLREGLILAFVFLILSLPATILTAVFLDISGILPPKLRGMAPYVNVFAGVLGFVFLVVGAAHLALKVAVAGMAAPAHEPFPLTSGRGPRFFAGWPLALLLGTMAGGASAALFHILKIKAGSAFEAMFGVLPKVNEYSPAAVHLVLLPTYLAAAIAEEIFYRGVLQAWIARALGATRIGTGAAVTIASLLWAIAHAGNAEPMLLKLAQVFVLGLIFGWIAYRYSVEAAIVAHAGLNVTSVVVGLLLMGPAALRPGGGPEVLAPPAPPADCEESSAPSARDVEYALAFSGDSFDAGAWTRRHATEAQRATVTWTHQDKGGLGHLEYLVYPCGYTAADMKSYFSAESFRTVLFGQYEGLRRTATCTEKEQGLTLYEFTARFEGRPYVARYWSKWASSTRMLTMFLVAPESARDLIAEEARDVFPALPSCPE